MTNAPTTRKTHVIRICGTNKNGDVLQDMWADVERIDVGKSTTQTRRGGWQGHQRRHRWHDDPNADDYLPDGNPARKTRIVKVCDPSDNVDDPSEWIPIPVIKSMKAIGYDGSINTGTQSSYHTGVDGDAAPTTRVVEARKISHYDTSIDGDAQAAFDADPTLRVFVVPGEAYQKIDGTKDDSQFVDHEVVKYIKHRYNPTDFKSGGVNTGLQTKMLNQYLIDESDPADGEVIGSDGVNPPYRLDPWQNIVNVQLKVSDQQWLVSFINEVVASNFPSHCDTESSLEDGWVDSFTGASGSGFTVVAGAVAYGKITNRDGSTSSVFLACRTDMKNVSLGTPDALSGTVSWRSVYSVSGGITGISYANDRFFITWQSDDDIGTTYVTSTKDGISFSAKSSPLPSPALTDGVAKWGGVAYNKRTKTYAMAGFAPFWDPDNHQHFGNNFSWATSSDGVSWSGGVVDGWITNPGGTGDGFGGVTNFGYNTIAAGNGVFVAASEFKIAYMQFPPDTDPDFNFDFNNPAAAVAVSRDGKTWSSIRLPGSLSSYEFQSFQSSGQINSVAFVEDKDYRDAAGNTGYFVAAGIEYDKADAGGGTGFSRLWRSVNGYSWELIKTKTFSLEDDQPKGEYVALSVINKDLKTVVFFT